VKKIVREKAWKSRFVPLLGRDEKDNLSRSNKERDASLADKIFWSVLGHLFDLFQRGVFRVTRAKDSIGCLSIQAPPPQAKGLG
jgi:hypothetical protein